jgi:signal transduction histidine kinase
VIDFDAFLLKRRFATAVVWLACASVLALARLGYVAVSQWRLSVDLLGARQSEQASDLLLTALNRDMQAVQRSVLMSPRADAPALQLRYEAVSIVASAFARYQYPESFFLATRDGAATDVEFFSRRERPPSWSEPIEGPNRFPVVLTRDPDIAKMLLAQIEADAARGRSFSVFEAAMAGVPYQVVARLFFSDRLLQDFDGAFGFMVNLAWVRDHYFDDLAQTAAASGTLRRDVVLAIKDPKGQRVTRTQPSSASTDAPGAARSFPLFFFNPLLIAADPAPRLNKELWTAEAVLRSDSWFAAATDAASQLLLLQILTLIVLALGLLLTARAARVGQQLAEFQSDLVSSVTHEFKTPLATIRMSGETLAGSFRKEGTASRFAEVIVHETRRLARLVDNLLAFSRVTNLAIVHAHFETVTVRELVEEVLEHFRLLLADGGFDVVVDVPDDLPPVRGDAGALTLLLDNLVDNAIRHSRTVHHLAIRARTHDAMVLIDVEDRGGGIDTDEIPHVTRKFYRGRNAGQGGTGLGLAIASRIAAEHGGDLRVARTAGGAGTSVRIRLPQAPQAPVDAREAEEPARFQDQGAV